MQLGRVNLFSSEPASVASSSGYRLLVAEFPSIPVAIADGPSMDPAACGARGIVVDCDEWNDATFDFYDFDARATKLERAPGEGSRGADLTVVGPPDTVALTCLEVLTRCQRIVARTNRHSRTPLFARIRERHRAMHDVDLPLVRADYDHAIDTWQWLLRLDPSASFAVQVAALFHDIERLASESSKRIEQYAPDYQSFKDAHARMGSRITRDAIADLPIDPATQERIGYLVEKHERPRAQPELALLNDADALSFFSLNSPGYLDYYGREQTRRKIRYTLDRMRPEVRHRLARLKYRDDFRELLDEELAERSEMPLLEPLPGGFDAADGPRPSAGRSRTDEPGRARELPRT